MTICAPSEGAFTVSLFDFDYCVIEWSLIPIYLPHCIEVSPSILLICQNKELLIYSKLFIPIPIQKHIILYINAGDGCCYYPLFLGDIFSYNFLLPHISITHVLVVQGKSLPINRHVKSSGTCPGFTLSTGCITGSFLCAFPLFEKIL